MNVIDILLILVLAASLWSGWQRGFLIGFLELIGWGGSLLAAFFGYPYLAGWLQSVVPSWGAWLQPLSFVLIVLAARGLFGLISNPLVLAGRDFNRRPANRVLGLLPGFINGAIYATLLAALLLTVPISETLSAVSQKSRIAGMLANEAEWANRKLAPIFDEAIRRSMTKVGTEVKPNETVTLHFKVKDPNVREDLEAKMLALVNEERAKEGLPPVKADPELAAVARAHARDMFARGYFSHYTPEKTDPFDRMNAAKVSFLTAGENLALGQTLLICHRGLMNSPGHRANILHKSFGRLGIGVLDGGLYGLMIAQEFRN
ncbi:CvpA family protein [Flaviaesturariibacter amylovorans]|uniref:SCP domain-containing protein n=1 Tax=Flaviaesturariibacter amylovorans TaxID=1084520 RepID=A0ABP8GWC4_9BACT